MNLENSMKTQEQLNTILVPKGENREAAEQWLRDSGMILPQMPARCLHGIAG